MSLGRLKGPLPTQLGTMDHLINFSLVHNQFSGSIPREWWTASNLRNINIGHNKITGTLSTEIAYLQSLRYLRFEYNRFSGTVPSEIGLMDNLITFHLASNKIKGEIPSTVGDMNRLAVLKLQSNYLTGHIPPSIGKLSNLEELHLNNNLQLTGQLPDALFDHTSELRTLDLSDCGFSGTLSPKIGYRWEDLEIFRISNNKFHGSIPWEFTALDRLLNVLLHGNDLTGTVPENMCSSDVFDGTENNEYKADCAPGDDGVIELHCKCCTVCCKPSGIECLPTNSGNR